MPVNTALATQVWNRYTYLRDNGHLDYVKKAAKCEDFFAGLQWDQNDLALLKAQRRPALTINKIISTISNVMGEQIFNRTDIAFKPRNEGATSEVADALTKVFMQVADNNQLSWARSDVFTDGIVTSRGFFDVRLDFTDSLRGEVRIEQLNPKNVLIDADADEYDPDKWNDVLITKWMSPDQIELLYGKADADLLRSRTDSYYPYGYDSIDINRDRFGTARAIGWPLNTVTQQEYNNVRNIRVIERQWKKLDKVLHFVDLETGDTRQVPGDWDDDRIAQHLQANPQLATTKKLIQRIRWTVIADNVVLHDDWSPYKHFTVVPYFPYFRRGRTVGLVENLLESLMLVDRCVPIKGGATQPLDEACRVPCGDRGPGADEDAGVFPHRTVSTGTRACVGEGSSTGDAGAVLCCYLGAKRRFRHIRDRALNCRTERPPDVRVSRRHGLGSDIIGWQCFHRLVSFQCL